MIGIVVITFPKELFLYVVRAQSGDPALFGD